MTEPARPRGLNLDLRAVLAGFAVAASLSALAVQLVGSGGELAGFVGLTLAAFAAGGFAATKLARRAGQRQAIAVAIAYIVVAAILEDVSDFRALTTVGAAGLGQLDTPGLMFADLLRLAGALVGSQLARAGHPA